MIESSDGLVVFRTYPHVDMAATGARAVQLLLRRLDGPVGARAWRQLPFLIPLPWQCTEAAPADDLYARLAALEGGAIESLSFAMGFLPADVPECGPAVLAYGASADAVEAAVDALYEDIAAREADFAGKLWTPEEAVGRAMELSKLDDGPVILADTQDNPGGGATSDSTGILAELVRQGAQGAVLGLFCDPEAAAAAHEAGMGATVDLALGGKAGPGGPPFEGRFRVEALGTGEIAATGPYYLGSRMRLGPMALLEIGGVRVAVSSRKQQAADQAMFRHLGIAPGSAKILALKSSVHFRADFAPIAREILVVRAPGANVADPAELPYAKLREGMRLGPLGPAFKRTKA